MSRTWHSTVAALALMCLGCGLPQAATDQIEIEIIAQEVLLRDWDKLPDGVKRLGAEDARRGFMALQAADSGEPADLDAPWTPGPVHQAVSLLMSTAAPVGSQ